MYAYGITPLSFHQQNDNTDKYRYWGSTSLEGTDRAPFQTTPEMESQIASKTTKNNEENERILSEQRDKINSDTKLNDDEKQERISQLEKFYNNDSSQEAARAEVIGKAIMINQDDALKKIQAEYAENAKGYEFLEDNYSWNWFKNGSLNIFAIMNSADQIAAAS